MLRAFEKNITLLLQKYYKLIILYTNTEKKSTLLGKNKCKRHKFFTRNLDFMRFCGKNRTNKNMRGQKNDIFIIKLLY